MLSMVKNGIDIPDSLFSCEQGFTVTLSPWRFLEDVKRAKPEPPSKATFF
jgi:hypothetical protein